MLEYFEAEMRLLHEVAQEFARAFPEQAKLLNLENLKDRDPYVERLLEGMAFLSAQIRQRIDDDLPEVSEGLLNLLWPHFLRPLPSLTIVEFTPRMGQLQQTQVLPRHTSLLAAPVTTDTPVGKETLTCRFRTTYPLTVHPVRLAKVTAEQRSSGGTVIKFKFEADPGVKLDALGLKQLPLYIHADPSVAALVYKALVGNTQLVQVRFPEQPLKEARRLGGQLCVQPCHLGADEALIPLNGRSFSGFHLLQEYFAFREKYLFVSLEGLDLITWPQKIREFEIEVQTADIFPGEVSVSVELFKLYCCPAINLFKRTAEPVKLSQKRYEYPVVADVHLRYSTEVYSVDGIVGMDVKTGERNEYTPLYSFKHEKTGRSFSSSRRVLGSGRAETYITVADGGKFREQSLSCEITASNGHIPRAHLQVGSITTPGSDCPGFVSLRNITRPTRMLVPPERDAYQWSLISHLAMNYASLADTDVLRRLLSLYEWTQDESNKRRIKGLEVESCKPAELVRQGALMRGTEFNLLMNDASYGSVSDSYLFGMVLHKFFCSYASINTFTRTRVHTHPSNLEFQWQPMFGEASRN